jgi:phage gpG-like protein
MMGFAVTVEVEGIEELQAALRKLSPEQNRNIMRESLLDCAAIIIENAKTKQIIRGGRGIALGPRGGRRLVDKAPDPKRLTSRSGRLRDSISWNLGRTYIDVGSDVKYARVHELGYSGPVSIKEHKRTITQAFGRKIKPTEVTVHAHSRVKVNYPKRPFLTPAIQATEGRFPGIFKRNWIRYGQ